MDYKPLLKLAITAALKAGEKILEIYNTDFYIETKADNTPVTQADKSASKCIIAQLASSGFPVISEEEETSDYATRQGWGHFWLVDPLDGTKEFIKRNGEFAVNIALVNHDTSVIGVIYAPVLREIYFASAGGGSYKFNLSQLGGLPDHTWHEEIFSLAQKLPLQRSPQRYTVVVSRSHLSRDLNSRVQKLESMYGPVDMINIGSSIKQGWVAEGRAHEYPRYGTTMEWDTAAGQCILEEAGKKLIDLETMLPMRYNKESMKNHFFVASV